MRKSLVLAGFLLVITGYVVCAEDLAEEQGVLEEMIGVMESYTAAIEGSDAVETMTDALTELAAGLESLIPRMMEMSESHPEWGDNPPEELKETMTRYMEVSREFFMNALSKATEFANKYQDNIALQEAHGKLNQVMSQCVCQVNRGNWERIEEVGGGVRQTSPPSLNSAIRPRIGQAGAQHRAQGIACPDALFGITVVERLETPGPGEERG